MIAALLDHLWQSTLVAAGAGLLTLVLRGNGAQARFWLWFAASIKFLVPFSALALLGEYLSRLFPATLAAAPRLLAIQPAAERFSAPARLLAGAPESMNLAPWLLALWVSGFVLLLGLRLARGLRLRALLGEARDISMAMAMAAPVQVKASDSLLEPGLVGIRAPVILLPAGLLARLSRPEMESILAHELCHLARRDNLTAALHMLVETLFWFYPVVWLIGARLIAERERACDESVLARGHDPETYARGILKVCKFCIQSPLACAAGATGADLGLRVTQIMTGAGARDLNLAKRMLLAGAGMMLLVMPVTAGFLTSPLAAAVQKNVVAVRMHYEMALASGVAAMAQRLAAVPENPPRFRIIPVAAVAAVLPQYDIAPPPGAPASADAPPAAPPDGSKAVVAASANDGFRQALQQAALMLAPTGAGDPDAVTCRIAQHLPGSRLPGPEICKPNHVWAQLRASHEDYSADGKSLVATTGARPLALCARPTASVVPGILTYSVVSTYCY